MLCTDSKKKHRYQGGKKKEWNECCGRPSQNNETGDDFCNFEGLRNELRRLVGSFVEKETTGGPVEGVLAAVRQDYAVVTDGTSTYFVPFKNIQSVVKLG
ncbi:DUF2642 domain-containing protein [Cytobacillus sp. FSL K6-0129]|uniref:DUF2642 domain-containing protein n=1 Tax=Cytobacillus sp. FSL K6-0129 TaxID=2921421 RepID=UPI0030FCFAE2